MKIAVLDVVKKGIQGLFLWRCNRDDSRIKEGEVMMLDVVARVVLQCW